LKASGNRGIERPEAYDPEGVVMAKSREISGPADRITAVDGGNAEAVQVADARPLRETTRALVGAIAFDIWPPPSAVVDFGLDSHEHHEALAYPFRKGEITPETLDAALGNGEQLTALARAALSNPYKEITFHTAWDDLRREAVVRDGGGSVPSPSEIVRENGPSVPEAHQGPEKKRGR
jgi:hypothetical protein